MKEQNKLKTLRTNWNFKRRAVKIVQTFATNNIIADDDINKELFPKFCFSGQKIFYKQLSDFNNVPAKNNFERLKLFLLSPFGIGGLLLLLLIIFCGIFIPLSTLSPYTTDPNNTFLDFGVDGHIFGTDNLGRDIWARTFWGLRNSLGIAFAAVAIDLFVGITIGVLMGYFQIFDQIFSFIIKILNTIPQTIILILVTIVLTANVGSIILGIIITGWITMCLQVRGYILRYSRQDFVTSSKMLGTPSYKIIWSLLPFIVFSVLSTLIITIPGALLADTSLSFLGIVVPNLPTLGSAMSAALSAIAVFPQQLVGPVFILTLVVFDIRLVYVGLLDVFRNAR